MATKKKSPHSQQIFESNKPLSKVQENYFETYKKHGIYIALGLLLIIGFIVFKEFLFLHKIYLYKDIAGDSINAYYPNLVQTMDYWKSYGLPSWSFNMGMGQNIGSLALYDPFDAIIYCFGKDNMAYLLGYKEFVKIVLAGVIFYAYLRTVGRSTYASIMGSLMFAFCGYSMVGSAWFIFTFEAFNAALLLLGFELIFLKNKLWLFPIAVFFIGVSRPFNLAMYAVFLLVYALFRCFQENKTGIKEIGILFLKLIGLGILGIGLSAPFLIDHLHMMLESSRATGSNTFISTLRTNSIFSIVDIQQFGTAIKRMFCSELLGSGNNFIGWRNILEAPIFYCGIPCLLLTPLVFNFLSRKQKFMFGIVLAFWLLPVIFPYFRYAMWFFSGDYYRTYSFFVTMIFIVFSTFCLDKIIERKNMSVLFLVTVTIGLLLLQFIPFFDGANKANRGIANAVIIFTLLYFSLLFWFSRAKNYPLPLYIFMGVLVLELSWFSSKTVNRLANPSITSWKERDGYNDYSVDAVDFIKKHDKSFFRIDKNYSSGASDFGSMNDALVHNYYGTSCYNSFNQKYYLQYLKAFGVINPSVEEESRWSVGLINRPVLQSVNSVKYILANSYSNPLWRVLYDSIYKIQNVMVLKNKFVLPLGFTYNSYLPISKFNKINLVQRDFLSLKTAIVNDEDIPRNMASFKEFNLNDSINPDGFNLEKYKQVTDNLRADSLHITSFAPTHIIGDIKLQEPKILYLSIPNDEGWHISVNGKEHPRILIANGMMGLVLGKGDHKIELNYIVPQRKEATWLSFASIFCWIGLVSLGAIRRRKNAE